MKLWGGLLVVAGMLMGLYAFQMDTTVQTGGEAFSFGLSTTYIPKLSVHNIGLMEQRQAYVLLSGTLFLSGIVLIGFGSLRDERGLNTRVCPHCGESIKHQAVMCRYCGQASLIKPSLENATTQVPDGVATDWIGQGVATDVVHVVCGSCGNTELIQNCHSLSPSAYTKFKATDRWGFIVLATLRIQCNECGHKFLLDEVRMRKRAENVPGSDSFP